MVKLNPKPQGVSLAQLRNQHLEPKHQEEVFSSKQLQEEASLVDNSPNSSKLHSEGEEASFLKNPQVKEEYLDRQQSQALIQEVHGEGARLRHLQEWLKIQLEDLLLLIFQLKELPISNLMNFKTEIMAHQEESNK